MEQHYQTIGVVRDALLSKAAADSHAPVSANDRGHKDLNLNLSRVLAYPCAKTAKGGVSGANGEQGQAQAQPLTPAPASTAPLPRHRATLPLQTLYGAMAVLVLLNLAFITWIVAQMSDFSDRLLAATAQASSAAEQVQLLTYDSSIDALQLALADLGKDLATIDHRLNQSIRQQRAVALQLPRLETLDDAAIVAANAAADTALDAQPALLSETQQPDAQGLSQNPLATDTKNHPSEKPLDQKASGNLSKSDTVGTDNETAVTKHKWLVNLGSFSSEQSAGTMQKKISALGYNVRIKRSTVNNKPVLKVQVGDFASKDAAQSIVDQLENKTTIKGLWVSRLN
jgi:cell division septation protein DedD